MLGFASSPQPTALEVAPALAGLGQVDYVDIKRATGRALRTDLEHDRNPPVRLPIGAAVSFPDGRRCVRRVVGHREAAPFHPKLSDVAANLGIVTSPVCGHPVVTNGVPVSL